MGDEEIFGKSPIALKVSPGMEFGKAISEVANKAAEKIFKTGLSSDILNDLNNLVSAAYSNQKREPYKISGLPKSKLSAFKKTFLEMLRSENPKIGEKPVNLFDSFRSKMNISIEGAKIVFTTIAPVAKGPELAPLPSTKEMKDPIRVFGIALEAGARAAGMPMAKKEWSNEFNNLMETFKEYMAAKKADDLHARVDWNFPVLLSAKEADAFKKAFNSKIAESLLKKGEKSLIMAVKEPFGKKPFLRFKAVVKLAALAKTIFRG